MDWLPTVFYMVIGLAVVSIIAAAWALVRDRRP